jgi:hypothetical protein
MIALLLKNAVLCNHSKIIELMIDQGMTIDEGHDLNSRAGRSINPQGYLMIPGFGRKLCTSSVLQSSSSLLFYSRVF